MSIIYKPSLKTILDESGKGINLVSSNDVFTKADDHGAAGDGVTNDTTAIATALSTYHTVVLTPGKTYIVDGLEMPSNSTLIAYNATVKLKNSASASAVVIADGATDVAIHGGTFDGNKSNQSVPYGCIVSTSDTASRIRISGTRCHNAKGHGIYMGSSQYIIIDGNNCSDNDLSGISLSSDGSSPPNPSRHITIVGNVAKSNGTHNIGILGISEYVTIANNVTEDSGTSDNITGYNASNKFYTVTGNVCSGGSNHGIHVGGTYVVVDGNIIDSPAFRGIYISTHNGTECKHVSVSNNVIKAGTLSGIAIDDTSGAVVEGNNVDTNTGAGITVFKTSLSGVTDIVVANNKIFDVGSHGIRVANVDGGVVSGNMVRSAGGSGISLATTCTEIAVSNNCCADNANYGVHEPAGVGNDYNNINGNVLRGNGSGNILKSGTNSTNTNNITS
jgi:parallel beta-helix repeat protein